MGYIYKITNTANDKVYVGKTTTTVENRWHIHVLTSRKKKRSKSLLYDAMNKYGVDCFSAEAIEECDNSVLDERERYWIKHYGSFGKGGYNLTVGGDGHNIVPDSDKALIVKLWNEGLTQKEISEKTGRNHKLVKRIVYESGVTRKEVLARQMDKLKPNITKPIFMYDLDGNYIRGYDSTREASADLGIHPTTIGHALNGRIDFCNGYMFRDYRADKIEGLGRTPLLSKREIHQYSLEGEYITSYPSVEEARMAVGLKDSHGIRNSFNSCKTTSGGYQWRTYKVDRIEPATGVIHGKVMGVQSKCM